MGAGRSRFQRVPSFTKHFETKSVSTSSGAPASSAFRSALATALRNSFSIGLAARLRVNRKVCKAACTSWPRIRSITRRAFCGDIRTWRARACASINGACVCSSAMSYAFGAAGAAPPPAGAGAAALSSAAFTAWPLKVRVGANSPSLCPIICSVTYTGINFFPLCTAMVCPIMSGTIVERRDHVLMTFFSLRVFSPSTLMRRWPSTNGPFFSERAIDALFLHSPQTAPLGPPHLLEPSYRPGNTVRLGAERANKPRALCIRDPFHNDRPARLAQLVQNRLGWSHHGLDQRTCRLRVFRADAFCPALGGPLHYPAAPCCSSFTAGFLASVTSCTYFRRSTMCLSVRLLCRVFFPNVGKAQGVCG